MKLRISCPNCMGQQEIEMDKEDVYSKMFSCGKCKITSDVFDAETGEQISRGAPYMPAVVVIEESSCVQIIIPAGIGKEDIVQSLKTITEAIESGEAVDGILMSEVAIAMETDRMIVMKTGISAIDRQEDA